jgi:hypothetical protein
MRILPELFALLHFGAHALLLAHALGGGPAWPGYLVLLLADLLTAARRR